MLDRTQYLLAKIAEEAGEVAQSAMKCMVFGLTDHHPKNDSMNLEGLINELNDLLGVAEMLIHSTKDLKYDLPALGDPDSIKAKWAKVEHYMKYSQELGVLEEEP